MAKKNISNLICHECGCELTDDNCRHTADGITGYSHLCVECESKMFERLAQTEGRSIALFHTCAALNVPCKPIVLDGIDFETISDAWICYINLLSEKKADVKRGRILGFTDGLTSLAECFGSKLDHKDFAEYIVRERAKTAKLIGSEAQREKWGTEPLYSNGKSVIRMTQEVYDELDRQYSNRAESYKGQTLTPQMEDILVKVAKSNVIYDHLMRTGVVKLALDVQKSIDLMLASENMRKKDEKPTENYRLDSQIVALENAGCMENGKLLPIDKLQEVLFERFCKGTGKYPHTLDIVDEIMERIWNTMRQNGELAISMDLPEGLRVIDTNEEMQDEKSNEEKQNERDTGATRIGFIDENGEQVVGARKGGNRKTKK